MHSPEDFTGEALQRAIDAAQGGGTIQVPRGVYQFGDETVLIPERQHRVQLLCEPGTVFLYSGPGAALQAGGDGGNTEGFQLSGCEISLCGNSHSGACCLKLVRSFWSTLQNVRLVSDNGAPSPRQTGLMISGGATDEAGFSAYTLVLNLAVIGSFKKGIWLGSEIAGGPSTQDRSNANTIIGGSVYCGASDKTGSIGVHIEHGDTNRVIGMDHDSLETGTKVDGHNNQINSRYENISRYAVHVGPTSQGSFIFGCSIPTGEWLDEGYETQYILTSQAGENKSHLTGVSSRYAICFTPRDGDPPQPKDGWLWYDWNTGTIKARIAGATRTIATAD